jgi:hypothetical protein
MDGKNVATAVSQTCLSSDHNWDCSPSFGSFFLRAPPRRLFTNTHSRPFVTHWDAIKANNDRVSNKKFPALTGLRLTCPQTGCCPSHLAFLLRQLRHAALAGGIADFFCWLPAAALPPDGGVVSSR